MLAFPQVGETCFIDGRGVNGPSVAQVPLLEAFRYGAAESRHVGPSELEEGEGLNAMVIVKVVVNVKVLVVVEPVIQAQGCLIAAHAPNRRALEGAIWAVGQRHKLQQVQSDRIHASQGDLVIGEDTLIRDTVTDRASANSGYCRRASRAFGQRE